MWVPTSEFVQGDRAVFRGLVTDDAGAPLASASFHLEITGPETTSITSGSSDADGYAEASWPTQKPNKRGAGGTTTGNYTATVSNVTAGGHDWDGSAIQAEFSIGPP